MISVIIPTLFKVERLYQTLEELSACEYVGEIILIDNTGIRKNIKIPKLIYICEPTNTYVNPAWNKGVAISSYDKLCILNDDTWFDFSKLKEISEWITVDNGLIGMSENNYDNPNGEFKIIRKEKYEKYPKGIRNRGYACCFFLHKKNWIDIPESMKIWGGDDYLFYSKNDYYNYEIQGLKCEGYISATIEDPQLANSFIHITQNDVNELKKMLINNIIVNGHWV